MGARPGSAGGSSCSAGGRAPSVGTPGGRRPVVVGVADDMGIAGGGAVPHAETRPIPDTRAESTRRFTTPGYPHCVVDAHVTVPERGVPSVGRSTSDK